MTPMALQPEQLARMRHTAEQGIGACAEALRKKARLAVVRTPEPVVIAPEQVVRPRTLTDRLRELEAEKTRLLNRLADPKSDDFEANYARVRELRVEARELMAQERESLMPTNTNPFAKHNPNKTQDIALSEKTTPTVVNPFKGHSMASTTKKVATPPQKGIFDISNMTNEEIEATRQRLLELSARMQANKRTVAPAIPTPVLDTAPAQTATAVPTPQPRAFEGDLSEVTVPNADYQLMMQKANATMPAPIITDLDEKTIANAPLPAPSIADLVNASQTEIIQRRMANLVKKSENPNLSANQYRIVATEFNTLKAKLEALRQPKAKVQRVASKPDVSVDALDADIVKARLTRLQGRLATSKLTPREQTIVKAEVNRLKAKLAPVVNVDSSGADIIKARITNLQGKLANSNLTTREQTIVEAEVHRLEAKLQPREFIGDLNDKTITDAQWPATTAHATPQPEQVKVPPSLRLLKPEKKDTQTGLRRISAGLRNAGNKAVNVSKRILGIMPSKKSTKAAEVAQAAEEYRDAI